jgi:hypothetical protein
MARLFDSIGVWLVNSRAGQCAAYCAALLLAAVALALIDDWYAKNRRMRQDASVAALEALFALPDLRDCQRRRY